MMFKQNPRPHHRPSLLDVLEPRRLLAGYAASFNFQPRGDTLNGWTPDTGVEFSTQGELTYGWDTDNGRHMHNRRTDAKLRYDTIAFMGIGESATKWEAQVPDGLYRVKIVAGDARYTNSRYAFDAEGTTLLDRRPNKANYWRKGEGLVWVSDGRLTVTSTADAINNKIASIELEQLDPHVTGEDIVNPFSMSGIVQNEVATGTAVPLLQDLGARNVKLWYDVFWDAEPSAWDLKNLAKYKKAGYTTTVTFGTKVVPTYEQARAFFQRIVDTPGATDVIDFWEMGNEPNHSNFWTGTQTEFIQNFMRPAYEVLKPLGEPTIGGGVTYNVPYAAELQALGYSDYCDYAGFHPYGSDAEQVVQLTKNAKAAFGGKPLIVTEWNVVGTLADADGWANEIAKAAAGLAEVAYLNFYFALETSPTHVGDAGVFDDDFKSNGRFYEVIKASMI